MRDVFQRYLRPLGGKAYEVRECRISGISYRSALRCVVNYELRLAKPGTGREQRQLVTGVIYGGGKARSIWERLQQSYPERQVPNASPIFEPFSYVPDLEMLVQVFPHDHRLPALSLLMTGPPPELEALLLGRFGPGEWRPEAWDVEAVRYRAARRATLRLTARVRDATTDQTEQRCFYAKVYDDEESGEQAYRVAQELREQAGSAGGVGFTVGEPIAYLSDLRTLLQGEAPGTSLQDMLLQGEDAIPVVRRIARALARLHLGQVIVPRRYRLQNDVAALERRARFLRRGCPHLRPKIERIIEAVVGGLEEVPPAPTHGDLKPEHVLLDGDNLALLDLDAFVMADPVLDVARFLAFLANAPLRSPLSQDRAWAAAQAFDEEYFAHVPKAWRERLPLHYARVVFRMATGFFRRQEPGWPEKVETLIEEAEDSLVGKVW